MPRILDCIRLFLQCRIKNTLLLLLQFPLVLDDLLAPTAQLLARPSAGNRKSRGACILSAGEESALLGHLVAVLEVGAEHPDGAHDAGHHKAHDSRVGFPVCGL